MEQSIATLSAEQAQQALMIFYDLLPDELWEGGAKPSPVKIESTVERLEDEAPESIRPVVAALVGEGGEEKKGEAAKAVLGMFYEQESLRELVERAAQQSKNPHLAPLPQVIGGMIVLLACLPKDMISKHGPYKLRQLQEAGALMQEFTAFVGRLPKKFVTGS